MGKESHHGLKESVQSHYNHMTYQIIPQERDKSPDPRAKNRLGTRLPVCDTGQDPRWGRLGLGPRLPHLSDHALQGFITQRRIINLVSKR